MKKYFLILMSLVFILSFNSCELFVDMDTTGDISTVSSKPVLTLLGDPIMELTVGVDTYVEKGVEAFAADTVLDYTIVPGNDVNDKEEGFYAITYEAVNGFGWKSNEYRAVLMHDGTPFTEDLDIESKYKFNNVLDKVEVSKYTEVDGYWQITNASGQDGISLPLIFADLGDSTYAIVPGFHESLGRYYGTINYIESGSGFALKKKLKFTIITEPKGGGDPGTDTFIWEQTN